MMWQLAATLACCLSADAANKAEIDKWQGAWHAVSMQSDGKSSTPEQLGKIRLTVEGVDYHFQNGDFSEHGVWRLHEGAGPKQLDIVVGDGADKGKVYLVIYKVEGDELTICLEKANKNRPTQFTGAAGSGAVLEVWKRDKSSAAATASLPPAAFSKTTIDLGIVVSDVERAVKFYTEAIGMTEVSGFAVPAGFGADIGLVDNKPLAIRVVTLGQEPTATRLKVMQIPGSDSKKSDNGFIHSQLGYRYLTIFVADTEAMQARLKQAGVKPLGKGTVPLPAGLPPGLAATVVRDPDGNLVELISRTK